MNATAAKRKERISIGISWGNSHVCTSFLNADNEEEYPKIIPCDGKPSIPICVEFTNTDVIIGEAAQTNIGSPNVVYSLNSFLGKTFGHVETQEAIKRVYYKVVDVEGKPCIQVQHLGTSLTLKTEDILVMVCKKVKKSAEEHLGVEIKDVVFTVAPHFNDAQRQAMKDIGKAAGLNVVRIMNTPTAACIAYSLHTRIRNGEMKMLVVRIGNSSCSAQAMLVEDGIFEICTDYADNSLGGRDFTQRLLDLCLLKLERKNNLNVRTYPYAMIALRAACERAKRMLSTKEETTVKVTSIELGAASKQDIAIPIRRSKFEEMNMDLFNKIVVVIDKALQGRDKMSIERVVVLGGSSLIPKIQEIIREYFHGKELLMHIHPEEAAAIGATKHASVLLKPKVDPPSLFFCPLSLGIATAGGIMETVIERNSVIPIRKTILCAPSTPFQSKAQLWIFEGQRKLAFDNFLIGCLELEGIAPAPRGASVIEVTFEVNMNGYLYVTASQASRSQTAVIKPRSSQCTFAELLALIASEEQLRRQDEEKLRQVQARNTLLNYLHGIQQATQQGNSSSMVSRMKEEDVDDARDAVEEGMKWLAAHKAGKTSLFTEKKLELERRCLPVTAAIQANAKENNINQLQLGNVYLLENVLSPN